MVPRSHPKRPYCLHCYAPLPDFDGASCDCPACGGVNIKEDLRRLWTLEPRLVGAERLLKGLVVLVIGVLGFLALRYPGVGTGRGHGMAIGAPIVLAVILWDAASLTRREAMWRGEIVWTIILAIVSVPFVLAVMALAGHGRYVDAALVSIVAGPLALSALTCPLLVRRWRRWREQHVLRAQGEPASS